MSEQFNNSAAMPPKLPASMCSLPPVSLPAALFSSEFDGQVLRATHNHRAVEREGGGEAHTSDAALAPIIIEIREQWRRRQAWHGAEKKLTQQAKDLCRRLLEDGDKIEADVIYKAATGDGAHPLASDAFAAMFPLVNARDDIEKQRLLVEARLRKISKQLPISSWVTSIYGATLNSLAAIIGECGDLSKYDNPAKLWKRLGLAPHDGKSYSAWRRSGGLSAEDWIAAGYSPRRRSAMWNVGGTLIGGMGKGPRPLVGEDIEDRADWSEYQKVFVQRLRHEAVRDPEAHAKPPVLNKKTGELRESFSAHAAARAKRYVEKRFVLHLWQEWRRITPKETSILSE